MADTIKQYGNVKRIRTSYVTKDGKTLPEQKEIVLKNCYIYVKDNGDSFVGTEQDFNALGIQIPSSVKYSTKTQGE